MVTHIPLAVNLTPPNLWSTNYFLLQLVQFFFLFLEFQNWKRNPPSESTLDQDLVWPLIFTEFQIEGKSRRSDFLNIESAKDFPPTQL